MYANKVKKIAAVHDLSGMGRVSLTVVIPILSSMGFRSVRFLRLYYPIIRNIPVSPSSTLTDEMPKIIAQWKKLEVESTLSIPDTWVLRDKFRLFLILSGTFVGRTV